MNKIVNVNYSKLRKLLKEKGYTGYKLVVKPRITKDFDEYYDENVYRFSNDVIEKINGKRNGHLRMDTIIKFMNMLEVYDINEIITLVVEDDKNKEK